MYGLTGINGLIIKDLINKNNEIAETSNACFVYGKRELIGMGVPVIPTEPIRLSKNKKFYPLKRSLSLPIMYFNSTIKEDYCIEEDYRIQEILEDIELKRCKSICYLEDKYCPSGLSTVPMEYLTPSLMNTVASFSLSFQPFLGDKYNNTSIEPMIIVTEAFKNIHKSIYIDIENSLCKNSPYLNNMERRVLSGRVLIAFTNRPEMCEGSDIIVRSYEEFYDLIEDPESFKKLVLSDINTKFFCSKF